MNSFYGGPAGQSFEIAEVFKNKVAMEADLQQRWQSSIGVGSFVFITYGLPGSAEYDENKRQDKETYGKIYNSSLWQKIYEEDPQVGTDELTGIETIFVSSDYGLGYRLITSMTGNTPQFTVSKTVIDADEAPGVEIKGDADNPVLEFSLPQGQVLEMREPVVLDANDPPDVDFDDSNINAPAVTFKLPQAQKLQQGTVTWLHAEEDPYFEIDSTDINNPVIKFYLPVSQQVVKGTTTTLDADKEPTFSIDVSNIDLPKVQTLATISFGLPQSQVMDNPDTTVIGPSQNPAVHLGGTVNSPKLLFDLPRAVKFYYGDLLGEKSQGSYTLTEASVLGYAKGDYYINQATGFVYEVTEKTDTEATFTYVACLQAPLPQIDTQWISPFAADGSKNKASVEQIYANAAEQTGQKLIFKFPVLPEFTLDSKFIGAAEESTASLSALDQDTMQFVLRIAQGSRIYSIAETNAVMHIEGSKIGDVCINSETGEIYEQTAVDAWELKTGTIKGPVGSSLRVVKQFTFTSDEVQDTLGDVSALIESRFRIPESDEIIAVNYQELAADKTVDSETAYWYFYVKEHSYDTTGEWGRVQLTGGVANLIENNRVPEGDTNKAYSVSYINSLIGGLEEADDNTTFSKAQVMAMMSWGKFKDLP